ncbi:glycoside hydrolase family 73 protein [Lacticaseibacillus daqingensis]|uniref:glycoside hydrolase family 73 protein n=1 Tax=Lacticaseibacillus daqingensis TaxID=2486014 RepID=UPI000F79E09C|nr:glycoside hydrolase family 73 protein [Lacticaseibacillus daqingensis]
MAKRRKHQLPIGLSIVIAILMICVGIVGVQTLMVRREAARQQQLAASESQAAAAAKDAFIDRLAPYAQALQKEYAVLPSITLAQAILESDWGHSTLASQYHNLFGIKGSDPATTKLLATKEYVNGQWVTVKARFRVYDSDVASMKAHALLFVNGTAWNANQYLAVRQAKDYKTAAYALKAGGYATDPDYPEKLIRVVETYDLNRLD